MKLFSMKRNKSRLAFLLLMMCFLISPVLSPLSTMKAEANSKAPTCGHVISKIEDSKRYIKTLMDSYKNITENFIPNPMHAEYKERYKELAQNDLDGIKDELEYINYYLQQLLICEDNNPYWKQTNEDLEQTLISLFTLLGQDYVINNINGDTVDLNRSFASLHNLLKKLDERDKYNGIYNNVIYNNEYVRKVASNYATNLMSAILDRVGFRIPSLTIPDKAKGEEISTLTQYANAAIIGDGINLFANYLKDYLERQANNQNQLKPDSIGRTIGKSLAFDYSVSNLANMMPRAMYQTYFDQQLAGPFVSASDQAFREDLSGNLASFMVSADPLSFAFAYSELVFDSYDYISKELNKVIALANSSLADYEYAKQQIQYKSNAVAAVSDYSSKVFKVYTNHSLSDEQYIKQLNQAYKELELDMKNIYKLDPKVIKIYINGKLITIPEAAYITNGTTMVPLRVIAEELNVKPIWNSKARTITFTTSKSPMSPIKPIDVVLTIGSKRVMIGKFDEYVAVAPVIKNGVTFVPLAFIANHLGLDSKWEAVSKNVILTDRRR